MGLHYYYCPNCAKVDIRPWKQCANCGTNIPPIKSKMEMYFYMNKAQEIYGDSNHWYDCLLSEVKKHPCFNEDAPYSQVAKEITSNYKKHYEKIAERAINKVNQANAPKCPTCKSTNIRKLSAVNRAAHGYAFGLFSKTARSQFCCNNCGYKW